MTCISILMFLSSFMTNAFVLMFYPLRDLAEDLQDALYKYLEIRGFNDNTARFLHDYMTSKDRKEYTIWLKRLKKFVEE